METTSPGVKLIECPRDAMQGWQHFIPTEKKIAYLNALLRAGFDTIDFGSFVSPKAIPQMADTGEVLQQLQLQASHSKLLAIVANVRGAEQATAYEAISYLGYPFSISETFQLRNTRQTISGALETVKQIQKLCLDTGKEAVIYISMGFGNPYGDLYNKEIVQHWVEEIRKTGISTISLADTVGVAEKDTIAFLFSHLVSAFPDVEFGAHFHSAPDHWEEKVTTAYDNGCRRFDSAINGIGGCPMAKDELVGNVATENLLYFLKKRGIASPVDPDAFKDAQSMATEIFI
ncbi:MAG TPA: hydroxymethylglutaryl-CoA lyase [Chitinophagaceae bacterium]|nr:hydroxymethylglutaryl-CoA lyase [Chitinophagaceae bacterium]